MIIKTLSLCMKVIPYHGLFLSSCKMGFTYTVSILISYKVIIKSTCSTI